MFQVGNFITVSYKSQRIHGILIMSTQNLGLCIHDWVRNDKLVFVWVVRFCCCFSV